MALPLKGDDWEAMIETIAPAVEAAQKQYSSEQVTHGLLMIAGAIALNSGCPKRAFVALARQSFHSLTRGAAPPL